MIDGCVAWQKSGLQPPQAVTAATGDYLDGQDLVRSGLPNAAWRRKPPR